MYSGRKILAGLLIIALIIISTVLIAGKKNVGTNTVSGKTNTSGQAGVTDTSTSKATATEALNPINKDTENSTATSESTSETTESSETTEAESPYGWKKDGDSWVYVNADGSISNEDRSGSLPTIDKYLGCSHLAGWMTEHFDDYKNTNFVPMTDFTDTPEMLLRNYKEYGDESSMNCTGFVAHLLKSAGGNLDLVSYMGLNGKYANADNYLRLATRGYVQYYTYNSVDEFLQSGRGRKGDILYLEPDWNRTGADCHIGVFWGDTPSENKFWNQNWNIKNDISGIVMDDPVEKIYHFPINGY